MRRLLALFRKKSSDNQSLGYCPCGSYDTRTEMVYSYELELLRLAAFRKGEREQAIKKLWAFSAWRLANGR